MITELRMGDVRALFDEIQSLVREVLPYELKWHINRLNRDIMIEVEEFYKIEYEALVKYGTKNEKGQYEINKSTTKKNKIIPNPKYLAFINEMKPINDYPIKVEHHPFKLKDFKGVSISGNYPHFDLLVTK